MTRPPSGPQAYSQTERRTRAELIVARLRQHFGADLLALGLYGSLSRGTDGPFSDIEIHCVIAGSAIDTSYEWSEGPWKAEVDVYSPDVILASAAELDEFWPITHGAYTHVVPILDDGEIFPRIAQAVLGHSDAEFDTLMREVLIGDFYEVVGKARNAVAQNRPFSLAGEAVDAARYAACLMGLAQRKLFSTGSLAFSEALQLPDRPAHFDDFLNLVLSGDLRDNPRVAAALDALWEGMEEWALRRGLRLHHRFDELLDNLDRT
jgi:kanamycin nucleotidyltransferase